MLFHGFASMGDENIALCSGPLRTGTDYTWRIWETVKYFTAEIYQMYLLKLGEI